MPRRSRISTGLPITPEPIILHEGVRAEGAGFGQPADFLDHRQRRVAPDHQHPGLRRAGVGEAVHHAPRREGKTPCLQPLAPVTKDELHRAPR
jgi:hypothetical protein